MLTRATHYAEAVAPPQAWAFLKRNADSRQQLLQMRCGSAGGRSGHLGRGSRCNHISALLARTRANIHHPVTRRYHAHVMLHHDDRVARSDQRIELRHQLVHVCSMQPGRWLIEDIESRAALGPLQFGRKLDALGLSAGKLGGRLTEPQVTQANLPQNFKGPEQRRLRGKELPRCIHG